MRRVEVSINERYSNIVSYREAVWSTLRVVLYDTSLLEVVS